jgi:hypothetical protein
VARTPVGAIIAAMDQHAAPFAVARQAQPAVQSREEVAGNRRCGPDLHGYQPAAQLDDDVDFVSCVVAPEEERRFPAGSGKYLEELGDHERFEDRPAQRMRGQFGVSGVPEQVAQESGIEEVERRALDEALREVRTVRLEQDDQAARHEDGEPAPRGGVADTGVGPERREVQQLPGPAGAEAHEAAEDVKVANRQKVAHVALDMGPLVRGHPVGRLRPGVVDRRVQTLAEDPFQAERGRLGTGRHTIDAGSVHLRPDEQLREAERSRKPRGSVAANSLWSGSSRET